MSLACRAVQPLGPWGGAPNDRAHCWGIREAWRELLLRACRAVSRRPVCRWGLTWAARLARVALSGWAIQARPLGMRCPCCPSCAPGVACGGAVTNAGLSDQLLGIGTQNISSPERGPQRRSCRADVLDISSPLNDAAAAIVDDSFLRCFKARAPGAGEGYGCLGTAGVDAPPSALLHCSMLRRRCSPRASLAPPAPASHSVVPAQCGTQSCL